MKSWVFVVWSALVISIFSVSAAAGSATVRQTTDGAVVGTLKDGTLLFRGIPYAAPPVGANRWKPPQPVVPWAGERTALRSGPPCLQRSYGWNAADAAAGSEDCLYLDVRVPPHANGEMLPVMVWIHGGANRAGSGIGYTDSAIADRGVVLVTLQYRLGVFGFFSYPALTDESPHRTSGNYAILDQIAVLKWVRSNIAAFDGDPGNVTIFGQSAGAQDVGILMLSPLARGLFHKAIAQSGTAGFGLPPRSLHENEALGRDLAKRLHLPAGKAGLAALRAASPAAVMAAADALVPPIEDAGFIWDQAVVDGYVLPRSPLEILNAGEQAPVPLVIGNNARELTLFGGPGNVRHVVSTMFAGKAAEAMKLYGLDTVGDPSDDPVLGSVATRVADDVMFRGPVTFVAERQTAIGQNVWRYQFDVAKQGSPDPVWHSSELSYVFDKTPEGAGFGAWPPVQRYWTNFAKTGDPNDEGLPHWSAYGGEKNYLEFTAAGPVAGKDLCGDLCRLIPRP